LGTPLYIFTFEEKCCPNLHSDRVRATRQPGRSSAAPVQMTTKLTSMTDTRVKTERKRTAAEKAARKRRRLEYEFVFMNGK